MKKDFDIVRVELGPDSYDIVIGSGALDSLTGFVSGKKYSRSALIITDTNVGPLYADRVKALLRQPASPRRWPLFRPEKHPSLSRWQREYTLLLSRRDLIVIPRSSPSAAAW